MKIIDIATQVGYKNLSQFNVLFKEKFGMTPNEYRKNSNSND
jgi:AraC-like DNA-binding protein